MFRNCLPGRCRPSLQAPERLRTGVPEARKNGWLRRTFLALAQYPVLCGSLTSPLNQMTGSSFEPTAVPEASRLGRHATETLARCRQENDVLLFQGSKNLKYRLGGDDHDQFSVVKTLFAHVGLAVAPDGRPLGVLHSLPWTTDPDMTDYWAGRNLASLSRFGHDMASRIAGQCPKSRVHLICDVADGLYDLFERHAGMEKDVSLLVRAKWARKTRIESPDTGRPDQAVRHLAAKTPVMRHCRLEVGEGRNTQGRDVRTARVSLSSGTVGLLAPAALGRCPPVYVTAILVTEDDSPPNRRRLEWLLLSSSPGLDGASIRDCLSQYEQRWTFDEFFRVLNAGTQAEHRTLCDYYGYLRETYTYEGWLASDSVHAWSVLDLRRLMHVAPHLPAEEAVKPMELLALHLARRRHSDPPADPRGRPPSRDIRSVVIDIGKLGGFLPSKQRVLPGRKAVWRGDDRLRTMVLAYEVAQARRAAGH